MRKYLEVFKLSFKTQIIWRFDAAMTMVATVGRILAAWILWSAVFGSKKLVSGFTFQSMLSYYIVSSFITSLDMSQQISGEISELIRAGRFSGRMVTPMNPLGFFGSMIAGESAFRLGFSLFAAFICTVIFNIRLTLTASVIQILLALAMITLGLIFMACLQYFIGITAFKFQDIGFFLHVQSAIIAFATGSMIPLSLLPGTALYFLRFIPFTYVTYMPTMLLTGQICIAEGTFGIAILSVWTAAMLFAGQFTYNRLRVRYDGVGI